MLGSDAIYNRNSITIHIVKSLIKKYFLDKNVYCIESVCTHSKISEPVSI